jgi:hypothetical protein
VIRLSAALCAAAVLSALAGAPGSRATANGPTYQGVDIDLDLPVSEHLRNKAGTDGAGLCVWTSMDHAARWEDIPELIGTRDRMTRERGGGWPDRVASVLKRDAPDLGYVQYQGTDPSILDLAIAAGRMPCVTYGWSERYNGGQTIAHMVNLACLNKQVAAVLDNNFPGTYEWMPRDEFLRRWAHPNGSGWAYVLLGSPPPPAPSN